MLSFGCDAQNTHGDRFAGLGQDSFDFRDRDAPAAKHKQLRGTCGAGEAWDRQRRTEYNVSCAHSKRQGKRT